VKRIDALTREPAAITPEQGEEIARLLVSMEGATDRLGSSGTRTNHPLIDEHRAQFRADLEAARRGVLAKPPSYRLAEDVSTACMRCHEHGTR
jgi:cytochrome c553